MSGIAGIIDLRGGDVPPGLIGAMTADMAHRGPDGIGHWQAGPVALGQCLLHATPQSLDETLPRISDDGQRVLVMDGRVDNWQELGAALRQRGRAPARRD